MSEPAPMLDRVLDLLLEHQPLEIVPMFGGQSVMLNNKLLIAVRRTGDLLVRVDPERTAEWIAVPGASQSEMGSGRSMGPSWVQVDASSLDAERLAFWIDAALEFHPRAPQSSRRRR